jgi:hypothetical protein
LPLRADDSYEDAGLRKDVRMGVTGQRNQQISKTLPLPLSVAGLGLLLALAGAFARPEGAPVAGLAERIQVPLPDWLIITTLAALVVASFTFITMLLPWRRPQKKGEDDYELYHEPQRIPAVVGALLLLLALTPPALLGGAFFWLGRSDVSVSRGGGLSLAGKASEPSQPPGLSAPEQLPSSPASPVTTGLIGTLALLAGIGSLGLVVWLRFGDRFRRLPEGFACAHVSLAAAVEDSLEELQHEADARIAIIRIYRHFERALAAADLPRKPWQTPVEFMRAALGKLPLPAPAIANLTRLFVAARFSQHPVGPEERDGAWHALIEIRAALDKQRQPRHAAPP